MSLIVRRATIQDIPALYQYGLTKHPESVYRHVPVDEPTLKLTFARAITQPKYGVVLMAERDGVPRGFLIGTVCQLFCSKRLYATDECFVADEGGWHLLREFVRWARNKPGVVDVTFAVASGMGDPDRVGKLFQRVAEREGLEAQHLGGIYVIQL